MISYSNQKKPTIFCLTAILIFHLCIAETLTAQFLSNLQATRNDALYTTYCAVPERSAYKADQGYQLQWFDEGLGVEFISEAGPNIGLAFREGDRIICTLGQYFSEPVVMASYSDLVKYSFYPIRHLRTEVFFTVYSSETAIVDYSIINEGRFPKQFDLLPYFHVPAVDSVGGINRKGENLFTFELFKSRDGWMREHNIPVVESFTGTWQIEGLNTTNGTSFIRRRNGQFLNDEITGNEPLIEQIGAKKRKQAYVSGMIRERSLTLQPGDVIRFRILVSIHPAGSKFSENQLKIKEILRIFDPDTLLHASERAYQNIPKLTFDEPDRALMYWSAFSLMRQCMMPPEGSCSHRYYVFSREPRWGWGYGGQVFHESLTMPAYALMDPVGAMGSQRVYFERQRPDGYINYRTGPYLDETIETNGKPTTSAPWFSYQNLEIYKITGDKVFLQEAYRSGKRFYEYFVSQRDSNQNGLCEWGGHAELESVRDARVAVWDHVGWASNFEGPDVNALLVMEAKSLGEMAGILGRREESEGWKQKAKVLAELINRIMWDEETGFYYNVDRNSHTFTFRHPEDLKIREIIGFLPMWAGVSDEQQTKKLVGYLKNPAEFGRKFGVPSLTASHPYYAPIGYWNGPVWVQWNYLIYRGLKEKGQHRLAQDLSNRVMETVIHHLKRDHTFWEFYSADDLQAGWNRGYIWAGIAALFCYER